jgi:hypothetical protein
MSDVIRRAINKIELESIIELNRLTSIKDIKLSQKYKMRFVKEGSWGKNKNHFVAWYQGFGRYVVSYSGHVNNPNFRSGLLEVSESFIDGVTICGFPR